MRKHVRQPAAAPFGGDDQKQHQELPVHLRMAENPAHPSIEAEVDERSKRPNLFMGDDAAQDPGQEAERGIEGQGEIFAVVRGRQGQHRQADQCQRTGERAVVQASSVYSTPAS